MVVVVGQIQGGRGADLEQQLKTEWLYFDGQKEGTDKSPDDKAVM